MTWYECVRTAEPIDLNYSDTVRCQKCSPDGRFTCTVQRTDNANTNGNCLEYIFTDETRALGVKCNVVVTIVLLAQCVCVL